MPGKVLLIAFHFPPIRHSSGIQRTLKFCSHLRDCGWQPSVLTVNPRVYEIVGDDQMGEIPADVPVVRAFALDAQRHLAVGGRYLDLTARPDRYGSWWYGGVWAGLRHIRQFKPDILWSTTPVPTAHKIARTLHRLTGVPWVADFRDPITEDDYPQAPDRRERLRRFEGGVLRLCDRAVVTTPGTLELHRRRFPDVPLERWTIIPNGYDEENFLAAERHASPHSAGDAARPITLVHSGILYPAERDPRAFFTALAELKVAGELSPQDVRIVLRATCYDELYAPLLKEQGIDDIVTLQPPIDYRDALREMLDSSGLLVFQGRSCNHQIPAKLYEYMRSGRPILGLTDSKGDTADTLRNCGCEYIAALDDVSQIKTAVSRFVKDLKTGVAIGVPRSVAASYSRTTGACRLAEIFNDVSMSSEVPAPLN
jgi:glycosyltransferase involved in cell wall biosynthesis